MNRSEIGRFMFVGVMAEVLKRLFQINFNFVEGLDGISSTRNISYPGKLESRFARSLGGVGRTQFDGVSSGHAGWFRISGNSIVAG